MIVKRDGLPLRNLEASSKRLSRFGRRSRTSLYRRATQAMPGQARSGAFGLRPTVQAQQSGCMSAANLTWEASFDQTVSPHRSPKPKDGLEIHPFETEALGAHDAEISFSLRGLRPRRGHYQLHRLNARRLRPTYPSTERLRTCPRGLADGPPPLTLTSLCLCLLSQLPFFLFLPRPSSPFLLVHPKGLRQREGIARTDSASSTTAPPATWGSRLG